MLAREIYIQYIFYNIDFKTQEVKTTVLLIKINLDYGLTASLST